ncbi:MAG: gamma carbonic anhydrase family protein [Betaproteobacteria bacterium]|nr:gamma carbonic anhydrase family protein [Betaproteobacteria bacterium]
MSIYTLHDRVPVLGEGSWVAENASVIGSVILGRSVNIWFGAVLRGDNDPITVGDESNIQDGAILHTDEGVPLTIGARVNIGHMAMLHGCTIGDGSLIGINAVILNRAVIGKQCLIGANTLIPEGKVIPDRSLVVGTPGRIIRELSEAEVADFQRNALGYVNNAQRYREGLHCIG